MSRSVLVVEDDPLNSEFVKIFLESEGFEVNCVSSVSEAFSWLENRSTGVVTRNSATVETDSNDASLPKKNEALELVVTDVQLPDGNGTQIARFARELGIERVIAVSGFDQAQLGEMGLDHSVFSALLLKPVDLEKLVKSLRS